MQDIVGATAVATLPDLLRPGLAVAFVGINPSTYSVAKGHYFSRPTNRFWPAFSRSRLSLAAREALGVDILLPEQDRLMPDYGFGFTDAVKRATPRATDLSRVEFVAGVAHLVEKLAECRPQIACFHGIMAYRHVHRVLAAGQGDTQLAPQLPPQLGLQDIAIGTTRIFLVPNPSPANAHFTPAEQVLWYDRLAMALD
jgi:TDG/mug DNA glycosylase family protein